jgi:hypothetical protein
VLAPTEFGSTLQGKFSNPKGCPAQIGHPVTPRLPDQIGRNKGFFRSPRCHILPKDSDGLPAESLRDELRGIDPRPKGAHEKKEQTTHRRACYDPRQQHLVGPSEFWLHAAQPSPATVTAKLDPGFFLRVISPPSTNEVVVPTVMSSVKRLALPNEGDS